MTKQRDADEEEEGEGNQEEDNDDDDDDDEESAKDPFFESYDRVPSGISFDLDIPSSDSDDDDDDDDVRVSFASAMAPPSFRRLNLADFDGMDLPEIQEDNDDDHNKEEQQQQQEEEEEEDEEEQQQGFDYGIWMMEPMSVKDRRRKLLQGMGLTSSKNLAMSMSIARRSSRRMPSNIIPPNIPLPHSKSRFTAAAAAISAAAPTLITSPAANTSRSSSTPDPPRKVLGRSRSGSQLAPPSHSQLASLFRVSSAPPQWRRWQGHGAEKPGGLNLRNSNTQCYSPEDDSSSSKADELKIKNLDSGEEIVIGASHSRELEDSMTSSPIVKEVMRRVSSSVNADNNAIVVVAGAPCSSLKSLYSKDSKSMKATKKKVNWLKNIKFMASSMTGMKFEKEKEAKEKANERLKVYQSGKSCKELTGLYMCQEIQAHQGSIWTMKFSSDSRFLASAGEDRVVKVWLAQECDLVNSALSRHNLPKPPPLANGRSSTLSKSNRSGGQGSKRMKKGKDSAPDYIAMPETIFSLSAEPVCSLEGHADDVLDLSWSKSQVRS